MTNRLRKMKIESNADTWWRSPSTLWESVARSSQIWQDNEDLYYSLLSLRLWPQFYNWVVIGYVCRLHFRVLYNQIAWYGDIMVALWHRFISQSARQLHIDVSALYWCEIVEWLKYNYVLSLFLSLSLEYTNFFMVTVVGWHFVFDLMTFHEIFPATLCTSKWIIHRL